MGEVKFDEIGYWSEVKLDIVREYATAYSTILSNQADFYHVYVDGFSGPGIHVQKNTGEYLLGSPLNALNVTPPFREFFFVDMDGDKVELLRQAIGPREDVHIYRGDCNVLLPTTVFPQIAYERYRRGLCLLDPYGLQLKWDVIHAAGMSRTIDLFLNFQIVDANRNALWHDPERVSRAQAARMTAAWGDDSWRGTLYRATPQMNLLAPRKRN